MFLGVVYWAMWRIVLPSIFGYKLVQKKDTLDDGTVVTVVGPLRMIGMFVPLICFH